MIWIKSIDRMAAIFHEDYGWCIDMMSGTRNRYQESQLRLTKLQQKVVKASNTQRDDREMLGLIISIYGHSWCLDNEIEQKKLKKLIGKYFELKPKIL